MKSHARNQKLKFMNPFPLCRQWPASRVLQELLRTRAQLRDCCREMARRLEPFTLIAMLMAFSATASTAATTTNFPAIGTNPLYSAPTLVRISSNTLIAPSGATNIANALNSIGSIFTRFDGLSNSTPLYLTITNVNGGSNAIVSVTPVNLANYGAWLATNAFDSRYLLQLDWQSWLGTNRFATLDVTTAGFQNTTNDFNGILVGYAPLTYSNSWAKPQTMGTLILTNNFTYTNQWIPQWAGIDAVVGSGASGGTNVTLTIAYGALQVGDSILAAGMSNVIAGILDSTHFTVASPWDSDFSGVWLSKMTLITITNAPLILFNGSAQTEPYPGTTGVVSGIMVGSNLLTGAVTLSAGTNLSLVRTGSNVTFNFAGSGLTPTNLVIVGGGTFAASNRTWYISGIGGSSLTVTDVWNACFGSGSIFRPIASAPTLAGDCNSNGTINATWTEFTSPASSPIGTNLSQTGFWRDDQAGNGAFVQTGIATSYVLPAIETNGVKYFAIATASNAFGVGSVVSAAMTVTNAADVGGGGGGGYWRIVNGTSTPVWSGDPAALGYTLGSDVLTIGFAGETSTAQRLVASDGGCWIVEGQQGHFTTNHFGTFDTSGGSGSGLQITLDSTGWEYVAP